MTSQDENFLVLNFNVITKQLEITLQNQNAMKSEIQALNARVSRLENTVQEIRTTQDSIINRIDVQDRLIWGGISWVTFIVTFLMFMQSIFKREKSELKSESESRNVFTVEAVKELLNIFRSENK